MTERYALSPRTQDDLDDIWNYSAEHRRADQAEFYIPRLMQHIEAAAAKPDFGRPYATIRPGYRRYRSGSHELFYRLAGVTVAIVRVLHERTDFDQHL